MLASLDGLSGVVDFGDDEVEVTGSDEQVTAPSVG